MRKTLCKLLAGLVAASAIVSVCPVLAEEGEMPEEVNVITVDETGGESETSTDSQGRLASKGTGQINIRYYDDTDGTIPVDGAVFTIYKLADVETIYDGELVDSMKITPALEELPVDRDTTTDDAMPYIDKLESKQVTVTNGMADVDVDYGVYMGVETKPARYHKSTTPFIVTVPMTEDGKVSTTSVKVEPKAQLAGDISVTKTVVSKEKEKHKDYNVYFTIKDLDGNETDEVFDCIMPDGTSSTYVSGTKVKISDGQKLDILDVPMDYTYTVTEVEANANGAVTTYENKDGSVVAKTETTAAVKNDFTDFETGTKSNMPMYAIGLGACGLAIIVLLIVKRKKDKQEEQQ